MTETSTNTRILMVDDEPNVLDGYRRAMHGRFRVVSAGSGADGLLAVQKALDDGKPFPVLVSDMMMPGMNGAEFLGRARELDPAAVQMLLSGQADLESTISAVNNGNLFRFLTKPCATPDLERALTGALEQHRLVGAERDLLERTLGGAVDVLTELLSMASPEAFARTQRVRTLVELLSASLEIEDWRLPLATMLSQIGCVAVPGDVLHRAQSGGDLSDDELDVYLAHPQTARRLLERIPRLDDVARWIGEQPVRAPLRDGAAHPEVERPTSTETDPAALVLRAGLAYLAELDAVGNPSLAIRQMTTSRQFSQPMLEALERAASALAPQGVLREFTVDQVRPGMLLEADVETVTGMILVRKGDRISEANQMRLENFARTVGIKEPIMVLDGV
jgi:CheY-like chemotaxis protein